MDGLSTQLLQVFQTLLLLQITTSATSAAIANNLGNGFQVNVIVTAIGATTTMDVRIEESFDGGINWVTLYGIQRISAIGEVTIRQL